MEHSDEVLVCSSMFNILSINVDGENKNIKIDPEASDKLLDIKVDYYIIGLGRVYPEEDLEKVEFVDIKITKDKSPDSESDSEDPEENCKSRCQ